MFGPDVCFSFKVISFSSVGRSPWNFTTWS